MVTIHERAQHQVRALPVVLPGTGFTVAGMLIFAVGGLLLLLDAVAQQQAAFTVVALLLTVVPLALALVVRRSGWRMAAVAAGAGLVALLGNSPFVAYGLRHPSSVLDFAPQLWMIAGVLAAVAGAVVAFRLRPARPAVVLRALTLPLVALAVPLLALTTISTALTRAGRGSTAAETADATRLGISRAAFSSSNIHVTAGQVVRLLVKNSDPGLHTFTVHELGVDVTLAPASERVVELAGAAPGRYVFKCTVPGHDAMKGTLEVLARQ